jgi:hypothetical protein
MSLKGTKTRHVKQAYVGQNEILILESWHVDVNFQITKERLNVFFLID